MAGPSEPAGSHAINDKSKKIHCTFPKPHFSAPWFLVPEQPIISVEHPYIIHNMDRGILSLGGFEQLNGLVSDQEDVRPQARLYQRPECRLSKPLLSHNVRTDNLVLRITVPKRTGIKRQRGSQGLSYGSLPRATLQGQTPAGVEKDAQYLVRTMMDKPEECQVEAVGSVAQTHRFRNIPDFVQSSEGSAFMQKMKDTILPFEYTKMKDFKLDMTKGVQPNTDIIPPPIWSPINIPFNYAYRQNPGVKSITDNRGNIVTQNMNAAPKVLSSAVSCDALDIPAAPSADLPPLPTLEPALQALVAQGRQLMEQRPIFTRRSFPNFFPGNEWEKMGTNVTRFLFQYVGYTFSSGPWQNAIVKFGLDPRTDPTYRIYQTMIFVIEGEPREKAAPGGKRTRRERTEQEERRENHIFDGKTISPDGKVWQVCDVLDPLLKDLLATDNIREQCHLKSDGWYHNGTWAKAKIFMRYKINAIQTGFALYRDDEYARVAYGLPDIIRRSDKAGSQLTCEAPTTEEKALATQVRVASTQYRANHNRHVAENAHVNEAGEDGMFLDTVDENAEEMVVTEDDEGNDSEGDPSGEAPLDIVHPQSNDPRVLAALKDLNDIEESPNGR